ncbi:GNAT family N-acetyltransferase [Boudabousia marimammalium]|uniref:N-acetyltransferase domain-containing protein n=1 Tax=Boudabousia marimammalium TaxID=156892 RepID=A0A1Q5PR45_9ACTO|nr:GNAT family N-acetyltransferase [Boudabousia marimammalium]OKL49942.1 hypothetical protein BM477_03290 [Boudabousia marimammalium]
MRTLSERLACPSPVPLPPGHLGLRWEPLRADHAPQLVELVRNSQRFDGGQSQTTDTELADMIEGGSGNTIIRSLVGMDAAHRMQAVAAVRVPRNARSRINASLEATVAPQWRGRGIGRVLLSWQDHTVRDLIREAYGDDCTLEVSISAIVPGNNESARSLFVAAGYTPVRTFDVMYVDLNQPVVNYYLPEGYHFVPWPADDSIEKVRDLHMDAFQDHWGDSSENLSWWESALTDLDVRTSTLVVDSAGDIAGYAVISRPATRWMLTGVKELYIELVGVSRNHRGNGIARAMLSEAIKKAKAQGMQRFGLDVDVDSPSNAGQIYASIGFETVKNFTYYSVEL